MNGNNARENSKHGHVFRPGPFHRHRAYWLDGAKLHWRIGNQAGHLPLSDISALRLYLPEGGNAVTAQCVLVGKSGHRHKISDRYWWRWTLQERHRFGHHERRTATFRGLTFTLARRLKKANSNAIFELGPGRSEWIATCIVGVLAVAIIAGGGALMMARGVFSLPAAAFMGLALLYLPLLWPVIRSGGPQPFDPETLHIANAPADEAGG